MNNSALGRFLVHPARHWGVVAMILGLGLMVMLPAADDYGDSRKMRAELQKTVARQRHEVKDLDETKQEASAKLADLKQWQARAFSDDQLRSFRQEVEDWARKSGCQVRRIRLDPKAARTRPWRKGDSLERTSGSSRRTNARNAPPYVLKSQPLSVSVSGPLEGVKDLLAQLHSARRLLQSKSLTINPSPGKATGVDLIIELELFDLTKVKAPPKGATSKEGRS